MKRILSVMLSIFVLFHSIIPAQAVSSADIITLEEVMRGTVVSRIAHEGIDYQEINVAGETVHVAIYPNDIVEYAFARDLTTYYYRYENEVLTTERTTVAHEYRISEEEKNQILEIIEAPKMNSSLMEQQIAKDCENDYNIVNVNGSVVVMPAQITGVNADPDISFGEQDLIAKYPEQYQEHSSYYSFYCNPLSVNKSVSIRDTRNNYVVTTWINENLRAGLTVVEIAATLLMTQASVLAVMGTYINVGILAQDLNVSRGTSATSSRLRQGFIYDQTSVNGYVSVYTEYGNDEYEVTDQGNGYAWGEKLNRMRDIFPDSEIGSTSARIYNNTINEYGYWPWGNVK